MRSTAREEPPSPPQLVAVGVWPADVRLAGLLLLPARRRVPDGPTDEVSRVDTAALGGETVTSRTWRGLNAQCTEAATSITAGPGEEAVPRPRDRPLPPRLAHAAGGVDAAPTGPPRIPRLGSRPDEGVVMPLPTLRRGLGAAVGMRAPRVGLRDGGLAPFRQRLRPRRQGPRRRGPLVLIA